MNSSTMLIPQLQLFRLGEKLESVCVTTVPESNGNSSNYVCMEDIQDVFPNARRFRLNGQPIPFLKDSNGSRYKPLRIDYYLDKTIEVITETSESSSIRTATHTPRLRTQSPQGLPLYSEAVNSSLNSNPVNRNFDGSNVRSQATIIQDSQENCGKVENTEDNDRAHETTQYQDNLPKEPKVNDNTFVQRQEQLRILDTLDMFQRYAGDIIAQSFGIHEHLTPRLFIILPVNMNEWDALKITENKFRLHFLCECEHHTMDACKSTHDGIHIASNEGYEIRDPLKFYRRYGKYILILLLSFQIGVKVGDKYIPAIHAPKSMYSGVDYAISYLKALSVNEPSLGNIGTIDDYETLKAADIQQLDKFLHIDDKTRKIDDMYRIATNTGYVKWVCGYHYHSIYSDTDQKVFESIVKANGGTYDQHLGIVIIKPISQKNAREFFYSLERAHSVCDLDIKFDWDFDTEDLELFKNALVVSRVSILRLDLHWSQPSIFNKESSLTKQYGMIAGISELDSMRVVQIILPEDYTRLSSLQPKRSSHLHKLSYELTPRSMELSVFLLFVDTLESDKLLSTLNLCSSPIGKEAAISLSQSLKINTGLTTLNLDSSSIKDEGAIALSEALITNTSLRTLNLDGNSIGKQGAIALSEVLKTNTSLTKLHLGTNLIGNEGAIALSEALMTNTGLRDLSLRCNSIENEGAIALSKALNASLEILNLWDNLIKKEGAIALSVALKLNRTLIALNLQENPIGTEGTMALLQVFVEDSVINRSNE